MLSGIIIIIIVIYSIIICYYIIGVYNSFAVSSENSANNNSASFQIVQLHFPPYWVQLIGSAQIGPSYRLTNKWRADPRTHLKQLLHSFA